MEESGEAVHKADVIILGGGPAGASCALWLKQSGHEPYIIEKRPCLGGLQNDNPYANNWIAGAIDMTGIEYAQAIDRQISKLAVRTSRGVDNTVVSSHSRGFGVCATARGRRLRVEAAYLVVATGVSARTGGMEGGPNIVIGPGLAVEQTDFKECRVAILGGGDNGFENYSFIRARGARQISLFARTVRARRSFTDLVPASDLRTGPYTADPENMTVNGEPFDKFVVLYGWQPNTGAVKGLGLETDDEGFIATDPESAETSQPGIYAIGEVARRAHPCCVTAMADGVVAAKDIQNRLENLAG